MIRNVREMDLGRYECKAENALGMSSDFITLMGNPLRPEFDNKSNIASSTSKTLSWITKSISPIIDYKFKFRKVPTGNENFRKTGLFMWNQLTIPADRTSAEFHTKSYKLEALAPSTVYEVIVQARNQYGPSDDSKILRFATPSEGKLKKCFLCRAIPMNHPREHFLSCQSRAEKSAPHDVSRPIRVPRAAMKNSISNFKPTFRYS